MSADPFPARPWREVPDAALAPAAGVPTMLTPEEQRLYYWLARERVGGPGPVADLGCFVGGSAARLALGLADAGLKTKLHLYDRFTAAEPAKRAVLYPQGVAPFAGNDILPLSRRLLAPWADRVVYHPGDITAWAWPAEAPRLRLATLDICKTPSSADHVARAFLPGMARGGILVQQDFTQWDQPWTAVQTLLLTDWFEPVARVASSLVLRCRRVPDAAAIEAATVSDLDDAALLAGLDEAGRVFAGFDVAGPLARMAEAVRLSPGVRQPWRMQRPPG